MDVVAKIISLNVPTYASLFTVTAILAPLLEETVFRGFLLTSLTKFMPTPAAVVVSASEYELKHVKNNVCRGPLVECILVEYVCMNNSPHS